MYRTGLLASEDASIEGHLRLRDTRPFRTDYRDYLEPRRSRFNKIVGEANAGGLEKSFAALAASFRDVCTTVLPFQTLEHVDEPRAETRHQGELFDPRGRQTQG